MNFRVGIGFDLHRLEPGSGLILGGVRIPYSKSLVGHSDGDVLVHAITDALLGACNLGNIGELFPDSDARFKGISSLHFLTRAMELIREQGFDIGNIDSNVLAEQPKLAPFFPQMKVAIAGVLGVDPEKVSVKAKTMERTGEIGAGQAIAAEAVVMLFK